MSMGKMGLLGALSGLGQGLSYYGKSMFDDAIEEKRQARLQAIRDKEYARNRADQLADAGTAFANQEKLLGIKNDLARQNVVGIRDAGDKLIGVKGDGSTVDLGAISEGPQSSIGKFVLDLQNMDEDQRETAIGLFNASQTRGSSNPYQFFQSSDPRVDGLYRANRDTGDVVKVTPGLEGSANSGGVVIPEGFDINNLTANQEAMIARQEALGNMNRDEAIEFLMKNPLFFSY